MTTNPAAPPARRGQPLMALGGIVIGWIALRGIFFELPAGVRPLSPTTAPELAYRTDAPAAPPPLPHGIAIRWTTEQVTTPPSFATAPARRRVTVSPAPLLTPAAAPYPTGSSTAPRWPRQTTANAAPSAVPHPAPPAPPGTKRWSGEAWLFWREGRSGLAPGSAPLPGYGGSQAGAVLRYALGPASRARPAAYVRAVRALNVEHESDLAAGLALRPLPALPVTAHAELRARRRGASVTLDPAAFVSTGVDDIRLPAGFALSGYAQAGFIGGRDATGFADGSALAERALLTRGSARLSAGGGMWGGAQEGAARLDIGPAASARLRLGTGSLRVAAEYRLRVAGNAAPAQGAAVTLAMGF